MIVTVKQQFLSGQQDLGINVTQATTNNSGDMQVPIALNVHFRLDREGVIDPNLLTSLGQMRLNIKLDVRCRCSKE